MAKNPSANMDKSKRKGRKAHGHNGQRISGGSSQHSGACATDDALEPNPKGSSKAEGSKAAGKHATIHLCTYNVRTMKNDEKIESLLEELANFKWDVIGLSETKREGQGLVEIKGGSWLYNCGKTENNKNAKGMGFLINGKFKNYVKEIKSYSNRVIAMNVQLSRNQNLCIIQVYAPTTDYEDLEVEEVYEDVDKAIKENKGKYTIVMGDFNAKIGKHKAGEEEVMGCFGIGERNRRGEMLVEFATEQKLVIANSLFKKDSKRYWTWESPNGSTRNQIDFILSNQRGIIKNCEVITKVDIASDHRMVRATIQINNKLARLKFIKNKKTKKIDIFKLKESQEEFQLKLRNRYASLEVEDIELDKMWESFTSIMLEEAAGLATSKKKEGTKSVEDKEISELDDRRKALRKKEAKTKAEKVEYAEIIKTVRKKRRQRTRKRKHENILKILQSGKGPRTIMRQDTKKARICQLKHKDGTLTSDRSEILDICADFYQDLYNTTKPQSKNTTRDSKVCEEEEAIPPILQKEVRHAIKQMKDNKAPGIDGLTSDIIKAGGDVAVDQLTKLYNQILHTKKIPQSWKEAKIILLHKKDDKADIKNYRPISLLSHGYKIFTKIIQNRIKNILDQNQPREQAGFRGNYSTTDHLQSVNQLIGKSNEYQLNLCLGFIDYQKAFDSIEHIDMFDALRATEIQRAYITILEDIYTDATAKVHIDNDISKTVRIERGVRQGDTLSPKIFTAAMEEIFKKADLQDQGINIDGEWLTDLRFADDVALTTRSVKDMEKQLNSLNIESKKVGLQMHKGKTKYMANYETQETISIENHQIEKVDKYKYLGQTVTMDNNNEEEILTRIKAGWRSYAMHKDILTDKSIPMSLRRKIYDQCVLTTIVYGAETWITTRELEQKLMTTQRAMERRMLHLSLRDRVRSTDIRKKTKVQDILKKIKSVKWKWAGHLTRVKDNRWTKRLTEWQPRTGKRRRGRQKKRWRDDITDYMGTSTWTRTAMTRQKWKMLKEGFIQHWMK